jgi:ketosteroid isomerase-like protein
MSVDDTRDFRSLTTGLQQRADQSDTPVAANLRSIQEQFDAIAAGDLARVIARADAQVTLEMFVPPELPFILHASGADAFREAVHQNFGAVTNQRPEIRELFAEGNRVVLFGRETGTIRATGRDYDVEFVERFTFRDDRLIAVHIIAAHRRPPANNLPGD